MNNDINEVSLTDFSFDGGILDGGLTSTLPTNESLITEQTDITGAKINRTLSSMPYDIRKLYLKNNFDDDLLKYTQLELQQKVGYNTLRLQNKKIKLTKECQSEKNLKDAEAKEMYYREDELISNNNTKRKELLNSLNMLSNIIKGLYIKIDNLQRTRSNIKQVPTDLNKFLLAKAVIEKAELYFNNVNSKLKVSLLQDMSSNCSEINAQLDNNIEMLYKILNRLSMFIDSIRSEVLEVFVYENRLSRYINMQRNMLHEKGLASADIENWITQNKQAMINIVKNDFEKHKAELIEQNKRSFIHHPQINELCRLVDFDIQDIENLVNDLNKNYSNLLAINRNEEKAIKKRLERAEQKTQLDNMYNEKFKELDTELNKLKVTEQETRKEIMNHYNKDNCEVISSIKFNHDKDNTVTLRCDKCSQTFKTSISNLPHMIGGRLTDDNNCLVRIDNKVLRTVIPELHCPNCKTLNLLPYSCVKNMQDNTIIAPITVNNEEQQQCYHYISSKHCSDIVCDEESEGVKDIAVDQDDLGVNNKVKLDVVYTQSKNTPQTENNKSIETNTLNQQVKPIEKVIKKKELKVNRDYSAFVKMTTSKGTSNISEAQVDDTLATKIQELEDKIKPLILKLREDLKLDKIDKITVMKNKVELYKSNYPYMFKNWILNEDKQLAIEIINGESYFIHLQGFYAHIEGEKLLTMYRKFISNIEEQQENQNVNLVEEVTNEDLEESSEVIENPILEQVKPNKYSNRIVPAIKFNGEVVNYNVEGTNASDTAKQHLFLKTINLVEETSVMYFVMREEIKVNPELLKTVQAKLDSYNLNYSKSLNGFIMKDKFSLLTETINGVSYYVNVNGFYATENAKSILTFYDKVITDDLDIAKEYEVVGIFTTLTKLMQEGKELNLVQLQDEFNNPLMYDEYDTEDLDLLTYEELTETGKRYSYEFLVSYHHIEESKYNTIEKILYENLLDTDIEKLPDSLKSSVHAHIINRALSNMEVLQLMKSGM